MLHIRQLFSLEPVTTSGRSAATYVPWVMVSRGLAFLRTYLVARLLGQAGEGAFGLYQPALEIINPVVALVMFGAADVAERYVSQVQRTHGATGLRGWLLRQAGRIGLTGAAVAGVMVALGPWIGPAIWGSGQVGLLAACAGAIFTLALYQFVAAALRGMRAYGAAAGMEVVSATLLLVFSLAATATGSATWLMLAYLGSVLVPLVVYAGALGRHLAGEARAMAEEEDGGGQDSRVTTGADGGPPRRTAFAMWTMVRLLLVLLFGFLSLWGLRAMEPASVYDAAQTGQFAMPYRIAQLLGFVAVTAWASSYGIAARAWSQGQVRRAKAQYFRIGRLGMAALVLLSVALLVTRYMFRWMLPGYAGAIEMFLPRMLGVFMGYALLSFLSTYADLKEKPWKGAWLWGVAIAIQGAGIALGRARGGGGAELFGQPLVSAGGWLLAWSGAGLAAGLLLAVLVLGGRGRGGWALVAMGVSAGALFVPMRVDWVAVPVMVGVVGVLAMTGRLVRPYDWRMVGR